MEYMGIEPIWCLACKASDHPLQFHTPESWWSDSNRQPRDYKALALPIGATSAYWKRIAGLTLTSLIVRITNTRLLFNLHTYETELLWSQKHLVGFEPTNNRFAVCRLKPLDYKCISLNTCGVSGFQLISKPKYVINISKRNYTTLNLRLSLYPQFLSTPILG